MSKTFIVSRNGGTVTKAPINDNKIPIYDNESALDADLANIPDNTLVATKGGHDDVIDQMKEYIRNQNVLSDYESITLSTDSNNPTVMDYDGFYLANISVNADKDTYFKVYVNGTLRGIVASHGTYTTFSTTLNIPFKKGDTFYSTQNLIIRITQSVCYYKLRDYEGR